MAIARRIRYVPAALLIFGVTGCEVAKSESVLAPTLAGPVEGVVITPPRALEPTANQQIRDSDQPFDVLIENAVTTSPRQFKMRVQMALDANFTTIAWSRDGIDPGPNGQTRFKMPDRLQSGRNYHWRVMADDGANQSAWSDAVRFEVLMLAAFGAPTPKAPVANEQLDTARPVLRVGNGSSQGPVAEAFYLFQVSTSATFSNIVVNEEAPQGAGETALTVPGTLNFGTQYYWRARVSDGGTTGPWSSTESFRTVAAPAPGPTPGPSPAPGGSCVLATGDAIVACNRNRYGHMSATHLVEFLTQTARDLNAAGISGRPFGLLVKDTGHQCNGYSCDIICAGNGSAQRQWDVLGDSDGIQNPTRWNELAVITVRPCVIQN